MELIPIGPTALPHGGVEGPRKGKKGKLVVLVHGDDFVASGNRADIAEFRQSL